MAVINFKYKPEFIKKVFEAFAREVVELVFQSTRRRRLRRRYY
jgi:hypothetical protein